MKHAARATSRATPEPPTRRSRANCYLALVALLSIVAALLGAVYHETAVWATGLALFALVCLQRAAVAFIDSPCKGVAPETLEPP